MDNMNAGKHRERPEREGDRAPAPREVEGHMTQQSTSAEGTEGAADEEPETQGHMMETHPYIMEKMAQARHQDAVGEAERSRRAAEAGGERGLADRLLDRVRRRDNG